MVPLTRHAIPRAWFVPVRERLPEEPTPVRGGRRLWVALVLLAGYLLFCHGCHGDEDNELFAGMRNPVSMAWVAPRLRPTGGQR
jgi:hypothetical protein